MSYVVKGSSYINEENSDIISLTKGRTKNIRLVYWLVKSKKSDGKNIIIKNNHVFIRNVRCDA